MTPRILDRRSRGRRSIEERWRRWESDPPGWVAALAGLTDPLQKKLLERRLLGRPRPPADRLVVSVGNLLVGGTGKTPVVIDTAQRLAAAGIGGAVLTRGYGSPRRGPCVVDPLDSRCGDEARLMARSVAWPVIQAADRRAGFELAVAGTSAGDVILLEDAHQTAGVPRHRDCVIVDRWRRGEHRTEVATGGLIPWGPYREDASGADRADVLLSERSEGSSEPNPSTQDRAVLVFRRSGAAPAAALDCASPYGVVSGLARPEGFEATCRSLMGRSPAVVVRLDDHAPFTPADVSALLRAGEESGVVRWLTSGKDHGKLVPLWSDPPALHEVGLSLEWEGSSPADLIVDWLASQS